MRRQICNSPVQRQELLRHDVSIGVANYVVSRSPVPTKATAADQFVKPIQPSNTATPHLIHKRRMHGSLNGRIPFHRNSIDPTTPDAHASSRQNVERQPTVVQRHDIDPIGQPARQPSHRHTPGHVRPDEPGRGVMNPGFHIDQFMLQGITSGAWQGNQQPSQTLPSRVHPLSFIGILKGLLHGQPPQGIAGGNSLHNLGLHWIAPAQTQTFSARRIATRWISAKARARKPRSAR